jgi:hypothetical protein
MFSVKKSHVFLTAPAPPAPKSAKKPSALDPFKKSTTATKKKKDISKPNPKLGLSIRSSQRAQEDYL